MKVLYKFIKINSMSKRNMSEMPLYCLDTFGAKAMSHSFYMETLQQHLVDREFLSEPHKHDFYLLLYTTKGGGTHTIDFKTYTISPGRFFLMSPGQVHSWNLQPETDGYIIFFMREFYRMQQHENSLVEFPFFHSLNANPVADVNDQAINLIINEMFAEYKSSSTTIDLRMLRAYLEVLLLKLSKVYRKESSGADLTSSTLRLRKLEQFIDKHYLKLKLPKQYAELMNLSPTYLNAICKQNLDKTVSDLIYERIILEAKRLFSYADVTVSQVSNKLNFSEPSYFIRFFRKHTGITPEQFKESLNRAIE